MFVPRVMFTRSPALGTAFPFQTAGSLQNPLFTLVTGAILGGTTSVNAAGYLFETDLIFGKPFIWLKTKKPTLSTKKAKNKINFRVVICRSMLLVDIGSL